MIQTVFFLDLKARNDTNPHRNMSEFAFIFTTSNVEMKPYFFPIKISTILTELFTSLQILTDV